MNDEFAIRVQGRPPPKSEALSIFAVGGRYEKRVRDLLEAARDEMRSRDFAGFGDARLRMEVEVHTGPGEPPWDATNYLGGITDVLEGKDKRRKAHPGSVDHLGELAEFGLYDDDRQIKEISYKEVEGPIAAYRVMLTRLAN